MFDCNTNTTKPIKPDTHIQNTITHIFCTNRLYTTIQVHTPHKHTWEKPNYYELISIKIYNYIYTYIYRPNRVCCRFASNIQLARMFIVRFSLALCFEMIAGQHFSHKKTNAPQGGYIKHTQQSKHSAPIKKYV